MSAKKAAAEDHCNSETDKKRARRVSFAEITSVHVFDRDDEYETPPDPKPNPDHDEELAQFNRNLGFLCGNENLQSEEHGEDDDVDEVEGGRLFLQPVESPGSTAGSATSNDEDNFFGPVSSSFIRPGRLSDSGASDVHEITMDSTAFSQHFRSLAKSDSGGDLKTPTGVPFSFEENTPSQNTTTGSNLGSSMLLKLVKKPTSGYSTSVEKFSSGSDDMSLVEENPKKYDYGRLSFGLDALLTEAVKDLHRDEIAPVSNKNVITQSPIHLKSRTSPSKRSQERIEPNTTRDETLSPADIDRMTDKGSHFSDKLDDPNGCGEKLEHNHIGNESLGHTETDHVMAEVVPFADKLDDGKVHRESMEPNDTSDEKVDHTHTDHMMIEVASVADKLVDANGDYILSPNRYSTSMSADEPSQYSDLLIKGMLSTESDTSELRTKEDTHVENSGTAATQDGEMPQLDVFLQPHNESSPARSLFSLSKQRQTVLEEPRFSKKLLTSTPQNHVLPVRDEIGRRADTVPSVQKSISKLRMLDASPFASNYHRKMNSQLISSESFYKTPPCSTQLYRNKEDAEIKFVDGSVSWREQSRIVAHANREIDTISNMNLNSIGVSENLKDGRFSRGRPGISNFLTSPAPRSTEVLASEQSSDLARVKSLLFQLTWSGKKTKMNCLTSEDPSGRIVVTPGRDLFFTKITHDHEKIIKAAGMPYKPVHSLEESIRKKSASKILQGITSKDDESTIKIVDQGYVDRMDNVRHASLSTTIVKELDSAFREIAHSSPPLSEMNHAKESTRLETTSGLETEFHNAQDEERLERSSQPRLTDEDSRYLIMNGNLETGNDPDLNKDGTVECLQSSCVSPPPSVNKDDSDPLSLKKLMGSSCQSPSRERFNNTEHDYEPSLATMGRPILPNTNRLTHECEDLFARKRTREDVISGERECVDEIGRLQRNPKVHKSVGSEFEVLSGHHNGRNIETSTVGHESTLQHFTDVLSELLAKKMLPPSTDQIHLQAIGEMEDNLVKLQRLQTYEMHHNVIKYQKSVDNLVNLQHKKVGEAKILLHGILHKQAKLQLMRVKQERLQRNVQLLRQGIQEAQLLKLNSLPLISALRIRDANINDSHCQSIHIHGREEEEVPGKKVTELRQLRDTLESKITSLTKSVRSSCKLPAISSRTDTVSAVEGYLQKKACCKFLRSDVQLWNVHSIFATNGNHNLVLNYLDFITQRITIKAGSVSSIFTSNELNDGAVLKDFPNMDACTALTFSLNTIATQKYVGSPRLTLETQITSSVLGNLVDVAEEVQQTHFELQNLTNARFVSPSVGQLDLHCHFIGRKSGRKVALTLDMSCLKWGIYPSDITPYKLECPSELSRESVPEQLSAEIKAAIQSLGVGFWRILRICTTVSQIVQDWIE